MLITNGSRQCVLKLKNYSDKKANSTLRLRSMAKSYRNDINPTSTTPLVSTNNNTNNIPIDASTDIIEDRSILGRLLNCKPCRQVTETHRNNKVCLELRKSFSH
jgi:hypothetical protein